MSGTEITLRAGIQASTGAASFGCPAPLVYPDGRVAVPLDVGTDADHEYLLHPGDTFPVRDQTWRLAWVDNPGADNWTVCLVRIS